MAVPAVRVFFWFVQKTESESLTVSVRHRVPETAVEYFEIKNEPQSINITDGIAETDDSCRVVYTEEVWDSFQRIRNTNFYPIFGVTVGTRFFGPYDLESVKYSGESRDIEFFGRIDKEFEDTVIDRLYTVFFSPFSLDTKLRQLLLNISPFNSWPDRMVTLISASVGQEKSLSGIRGALNKFAIGVSPRTIPHVLRERTHFVRDVDIYPKYPVEFIREVIPHGQGLPEKQTVEYLQAGFSAVGLNSIVLKLGPKIISIDNEDIWKDSPPDWECSDFNNAPGSYLNRRIDIAVKNNFVDATINAAGQQLPRLILDAGQQNIDAELFIALARWQLQNNAVRANIKMDGNSLIVSGQIAQLDEVHLEYPYWRIISTEHNITPDEGHSTKLSMMLVQGLYNVPEYPVIKREVIDFENPNSPLYNQQAIPMPVDPLD